MGTVSPIEAVYSPPFPYFVVPFRSQTREAFTLN